MGVDSFVLLRVPIEYNVSTILLPIVCSRKTATWRSQIIGHFQLNLSREQTLLRKSGYTTLTNHRLAQILGNVFKIANQNSNDSSTCEAPVSLLDLINLRKSSYRGTDILTVPKVNTTTYELRSWRYTAAWLWKSLLNDHRTVTTCKSQKQNQKNYTCPDCISWRKICIIRIIILFLKF